MTNLGALDPSVGQHAGAYDINALGEVVGASDYLSLPHAFLDEGGTMHDLGTLSAVYSSTEAASINSSGVVAGDAFVMSNSYAPSLAWIWVPTAPNGTSGQMTDLNSLIPAGSGWLLNHATAVNDAGQIVGYGTINGVEHGFLLTPTTTAAPAHPATATTTAPAPGPIQSMTAAPAVSVGLSVLAPEGSGRGKWSGPVRATDPGTPQPIFDFALADLAARPRPRSLLNDGVMRPTWADPGIS